MQAPGLPPQPPLSLPPGGAPPLAPQAPLPPPQLHDIKVRRKKEYKCAKVYGVPPEEFGIARNARNIRDSGYCFHSVLRQTWDLIAEGYDPDQIKALPTYVLNLTIEANARDTVEEGSVRTGDEGMNEANRQVLITEHYVRMDYEGDGKAKLYQVVTGGEPGEILRKKNPKEKGYEDQINEIETPPFAAMTPVIMTHRFFGRSVADLVMDIMRIKTALVRGLLDNMYLHLNPRVEVSEQHVSDNTLDDLLVARPGGIVRTKAPGGVNWQEVPDISQSVYPALQYFDATREWRTGVTRQGQGIDPNALQNQVATIANQMASAAQAKTRLIARIFAETGIRDLFMLLHGVIRRNGSVAETVRLRGEWVQVDPRDWKERNDTTINVGLGTGNKNEQLQQLMLIVNQQQQAVQLGMVTKKHVWNSMKELARLTGRKDPETYFLPPPPNDPDAAKPIEQPPNPDIQKAQMAQQTEMAKMQKQAEIEKIQAQADIAANNTKVANEFGLAQQKFGHESQLADKEFALKERLALIEAGIKAREHEQRIQIATLQHGQKMQEHVVQAGREQQSHEQGMQLEAKKAEQSAKPATSVKVDNNSSEIVEALKAFTEAVKAPKHIRVRKTKDGFEQY